MAWSRREQGYREGPSDGGGVRLASANAQGANSYEHGPNFLFFVLDTHRVFILGQIREEHHDLEGDPGPPTLGRARPGATRPDPVRATPSGCAKPLGPVVRVSNVFSIPFTSS